MWDTIGQYLLELLLFLLVLIVLGVGFVGAFVPAIPGVFMAWLGMLLLYVFTDSGITLLFLLFFLGLTVAVMGLDQLIPIIGVKKFGGTKYGMWGSVVGVIVGFFFMPLGFIIGPFIGAFVGDLLGGQEHGQALKTAMGALLGFFIGTGVKLIAIAWISYYCVAEMITLISTKNIW